MGVLVSRVVWIGGVFVFDCCFFVLEFVNVVILIDVEIWKIDDVESEWNYIMFDILK